MRASSAHKAERAKSSPKFSRIFLKGLRSEDDFGCSAAIRAAGADVASKTSADENPREVELVHHWLHKGGIVLHFAGVDSISAAEELAGMIVAIPREERAALDEDEVYVGDLIGCALVDVGWG